MIKQRLVILSDLWGKQNNDWVGFYSNRLNDHFNCIYYDVRELATIKEINLSKEEIHEKFVNGGIEKAVENLIEKEKKQIIVLAFSVGGTIAWKAALKGLPLINMIAISSTRVRKEYQKPPCNIQLHFGDQDLNRPMDEWFEEMQIYPEIHFGKEHEMFKEENVANQICTQVLSDFF
jgi:dienelactone hydrolase